jgi:hypothetical protein
VKLPSKLVREKFLIVYELHGCQRAVNLLTEYYEVKGMKVILDGKRVGKGCSGGYLKNRAYFTKKGLNKKTVLHEFYHHLTNCKRLDLSLTTEEKEANNFSRTFNRN